MINNNKIKFIILGVILIVIFSFVFIYFNKSSEEGQDSSKTEEIINPETKRHMKLQTQVSGLIKTKDFDKCNEIKDEQYKTVCVNNIALNFAKETLDFSYCRMLDDVAFEIRFCELEIALVKSAEEEDISYCDEISDEETREFCIRQRWTKFAVEKGDETLCDNIEIELSRDSCYDGVLFNNEFAKYPLDIDCNKFKNLLSAEECKVYQDELKSGEPVECILFNLIPFKNYCIGTGGII